jgi:hypothetical protein
LLLSPSSRCGKSTLIRQLRLMAQNRQFSIAELTHYRSVIHNNLICGLKVIIVAAEEHRSH